MIRPLFLLVIALYGSLQFVVEAEIIPKHLLKEAILCLSESIGEGIVERPYRNDLTYGEYLGEICKGAEVSSIDQKVNKYDASIVQLCLVRRGLSELYQKFFDYGKGILENIGQVFYQSQQMESVESYLDAFSDLGKYTIGLCFKRDTVNFQNLESRQDKIEAYNCLEACVTKFLSRIETSLYNTKDKISNYLAKRRKKQNTSSKAVIDSDNDIEYRLNDTMTKMEAESTGYRSKKLQLDEHDQLDIDLITVAKKPLIILYSKVYDVLDEHVRDKTLDRHLRNYFIYYDFCAKVQCYMTAPDSVPLHSFINANADTMREDPDSNPDLKFYTILIDDVE